MSSNLIKDIAEMHTKFGVNTALREFDAKKISAFMDFRVNFLKEELRELIEAETPGDITDALVDLVVVALGTLDALDIDAQKAWDLVHTANMTKSVGIKASRPNTLGLPDLIKPTNFVSPNHDDNIGLLQKVADHIKTNETK